MSKGSATRVRNRERYERHKERIYMSTNKLYDLLKERLIADGSDTAVQVMSTVYPLPEDGAIDEQNPEIKKVRSDLIKMHELMDEEEGI